MFTLIRELRDTTHTELGQLTGTSRTTVAARVAALVESGLVAESVPAPSTDNQPTTILTFDANTNVMLYIAIDINQTRIAVCNLAGEPITTNDIDQEVALGPNNLMPNVMKQLDVGWRLS